MSPLVWLAIPVVASLLAAVTVPALQRHRSRELTPGQRAERLRRALRPGADW